MSELTEAYKVVHEMYRTEIEGAVGAEAVGELKDVVKEDKQAETEKLIHLVEAMNREMEKNESLGTFLMGIHSLIMRAGKPIPRKVLMDNGTKKRDLDKLIRIGFLKETYLRHDKNGALYACVKLPENVSFYGKQAVAVIQEDSVHEDVSARIRDSLGGVDEVIHNVGVESGDNSDDNQSTTKIAE